MRTAPAVTPVATPAMALLGRDRPGADGGAAVITAVADEAVVLED
jgi:hypothetical protein